MEKIAKENRNIFLLNAIKYAKEVYKEYGYVPLDGIVREIAEMEDEYTRITDPLFKDFKNKEKIREALSSYRGFYKKRFLNFNLYWTEFLRMFLNCVCEGFTENQISCFADILLDEDVKKIIIELYKKDWYTRMTILEIIRKTIYKTGSKKVGKTMALTLYETSKWCEDVCPIRKIGNLLNITTKPDIIIKLIGATALKETKSQPEDKIMYPRLKSVINTFYEVWDYTGDKETLKAVGEALSKYRDSEGIRIASNLFRVSKALGMKRDRIKEMAERLKNEGVVDDIKRNYNIYKHYGPSQLFKKIY